MILRYLIAILIVGTLGTTPTSAAEKTVQARVSGTLLNSSLYNLVPDLPKGLQFSKFSYRYTYANGANSFTYTVMAPFPTVVTTLAGGNRFYFSSTGSVLVMTPAIPDANTITITYTYPDPTPTVTEPTPTAPEPIATPPPNETSVNASSPTTVTTTTSTTPTTTVSTATPTTSPEAPTTTVSPSTPTTTTTQSTTTLSTPIAPVVLTASTATQANNDKVIQILNSIRTPPGSTPRVPGLAAVVVSHGKIVGIGAVGVRVIDQPSNLLTINDLFHLGSDTKSLTATMIARLIELGLGNPKLTWDSSMTVNGRTVTLRQLFQHRAGFPWDPVPYDTDGYWGLEGWSTPEQQAPDWRTASGATFLMNLRRQLAANELSKPVSPGLNGPSTTFSYSNIGPIIAASIAEQATGLPWERLMQDYLFTPLSMVSAGFGAPVGDQPWGHSEAGTKIQPGPYADNAPMFGPSGRVRLTLVDWATYANMWLDALRGNSSFLTNKTTPELKLDIFPDNWRYSMGWWLNAAPWSENSPYGLNHDGSNTYWFARASIDPGRDLAILVVSNQGGEPAPGRDVVVNAMRQLYETDWNR